MTPPGPPRLAAALLSHFLADNEPLAGDLLERFAVRQSRLWFWREVLMAIALRPFRQRDLEHPLGLVEASESVPLVPDRSADRPRRVNLTASPLPGVGGLSLVGFGVIGALAGVDVLWILVPAIVGGAAIGLTLALRRRRAIMAGHDEAIRILSHALRDGRYRS